MFGWCSADAKQISYSNLLGILAIAAVGKSFAAAADEDDAHNLLRFLMEARRSFDTAPEVGKWLPYGGLQTHSQPLNRTGPAGGQ